MEGITYWLFSGSDYMPNLKSSPQMNEKICLIHHNCRESKTLHMLRMRIVIANFCEELNALENGAELLVIPFKFQKIEVVFL